jgi:hypothetical protein
MHHQVVTQLTQKDKSSKFIFSLDLTEPTNKAADKFLFEPKDPYLIHTDKAF